MTPQTTTKPVATAHLLTETNTHRKSHFCVLLGGSRLLPARRIIENHGIPTFTYPNEAIHTINKKCWYESHRNSFLMYPAKKNNVVPLETKQQLNLQLQTSLSLSLALKILTKYGFLLPTSRIINTLDEVAAALNTVGRPVVVKTAAMHLKHKAKAGGVILGITNYQYARIAFQKLHKMYPEVLFQSTVAGVQEIIIGAKRDPQLGPFITVGLGGSLTDVLADRAYAFIPAQRRFLSHMFNQTKAAMLIHEKGVDPEPIIDALEHVSAIMLDFPQIDEIEINPAIVTKTKLYACDIKITRSQDAHWIHHLKKKS
jgi:acyl-CoA synthetase (NDP forming)